MAEMTVSISGLNKLDQLEIGDHPGVRFEEMPVPKGSHGELTLLTAYFTMSALTLLSAYLLRTQESDVIDATIIVNYPDGRREERRIRWNRSSTSAPEAEILKQIRGSGI